MKWIVKWTSLVLPVIFGIFLFSTRPSLSETSDDPKVPPFSARVQVDVAVDESMKAYFIGSFNEKLRSFGDIVVSETDPDYKLSVVAQPVKTKTGDMLGIIYSMVVTEPLNFEKSVAPIFGRKLGQEDYGPIKLGRLG